MSCMLWCNVETTFGIVSVGWRESEEIVSRLSLKASPELVAINPESVPAGILEAVYQIQAYSSGLRREFDIALFDLSVDGGEFVQTVYDLVYEIPFGRTRTYQDIATAAGKPGGAQAVGGIMRRNPLPLVIPCHRVIAAMGKLGGFAYGPQLKERLLKHEGAILL